MVKNQVLILLALVATGPAVLLVQGKLSAATLNEPVNRDWNELVEEMAPPQRCASEGCSEWCLTHSGGCCKDGSKNQYYRCEEGGACTAMSDCCEPGRFCTTSNSPFNGENKPTFCCDTGNHKFGSKCDGAIKPIGGACPLTIQCVGAADNNKPCGTGKMCCNSECIDFSPRGCCSCKKSDGTTNEPNGASCSQPGIPNGKCCDGTCVEAGTACSSSFCPGGQDDECNGDEICCNNVCVSLAGPHDSCICNEQCQGLICCNEVCVEDCTTITITSAASVPGCGGPTTTATTDLCITCLTAEE